MKIIGNAQFAVGPDVVYAALNDPAVLVRCIPGCQRLEALGEDAYAMTVAAGVGSIKGVYDGKVRLTDQQHPASFRMHAQGAGAAGTIGADVHVTLDAQEGGGTSVTYDADAVVGGMIGGVGQRMLVGVSKRMAAEFFGNVESAIAGGAAAVPGGRTDDGGATVDGSGGRRSEATTDGFGAPSSAGRQPGAAPGAVFTAPNGNVVGAGGGSFAQGIVVGAAAALIGALVGGWISRRGRG
jgi:carbon monoxide dehydrogenase subunit G